MEPTLYEIEYEGPGRLATMAKPRGGDWLDDEMYALRRSGVDVLVCLLTSDELREVDLVHEEEAAHRAGLGFVHVPVPDRGVPVLATFVPIVDGLLQRLRQGSHIVAHCRFGVGRSSVLAAAVLVAAGYDLEFVWKRIAVARGRDVPDNEEQRRWVANLQHGADADTSVLRRDGAPRQPA